MEYTRSFCAPHPAPLGYRYQFVEINSKLSSRPFKLLFLTLFRSFNTSSFDGRQSRDICEVGRFGVDWAICWYHRGVSGVNIHRGRKNIQLQEIKLRRTNIICEIVSNATCIYIDMHSFYKRRNKLLLVGIWSPFCLIIVYDLYRVPRDSTAKS